MPPPAVTVVIVAYDSGAFLQGCVDALAAQDFADFEAVIADNASRDGSVAALRLPDARFRVREMGGNLGFAAANNRVAETSGAEFLVLLNPDAVPDADWRCSTGWAMSGTWRALPGAPARAGRRRGRPATGRSSPLAARRRCTGARRSSAPAASTSASSAIARTWTSVIG
jgi:hypothetical protein